MKVMISIFVLCLSYPFNVNEDKYDDLETFTKNLVELRQISIDMADYNHELIKLIIKKPKYNRADELVFFLLNFSEVNMLNHMFVLQLNTFDPSFSNKSEIIPQKSSDYCCWKSVSIIYMWLAYNVQNLMKDDFLISQTYDTPAILYRIKESLLQLETKLKYFSNYFALRE